MQGRRVATFVIAAALSFSLAGCFGLGEKNEGSTGLTDMLTDLAENATEIARELEGSEWSTTVRAVVADSDGTQVAEITEKDLKDVLEVRTSLEDLAVRKAVEFVVGESKEKSE